MTFYLSNRLSSPYLAPLLYKEGSQVLFVAVIILAYLAPLLYKEGCQAPAWRGGSDGAVNIFPFLFFFYGTVLKSAVIIAWTELVIAAAAWYEFW